MSRLGGIDGRALAVLMVIATLIRVIFLVAEPHPVKLAGLAADEGEVARNIVDNGDWFVLDRRAVRALDARQTSTGRLIDPESFDYSRFAGDHRTPDLVEPLGPAMLLAGLWAVTGDQSYIWLQLVQLLIGVALTLLVVWLSLALFERPRAALAAGLLWAISPTVSCLGILPLYEIWAVYTTLAVIALYVFVRRRGSSAKGLLAVGLAIGLATLFRQGILLLVPALALVELGVSRRQALRVGGLVALGCVVALVPWTIRNLHEFGEVRPTNGVVGQVLWESLGEDNASFGAVSDDGVTLRMVHETRPDLEYGSAPYDRYLQSKALNAIAENPLAYLRLIGKRVVKGSLLNVSPWPHGAIGTWDDSGHDPVGFTTGHPFAALALAIATLFDPLLFLGAAIATAVLWRGERRWALVFLWAMWLAVMVVPWLVTGSHWRYVAPGLPILMLLSGLALEMLADRLGAWRRGPRRAVTS